MGGGWGGVWGSAMAAHVPKCHPTWGTQQADGGALFRGAVLSQHRASCEVLLLSGSFSHRFSKTITKNKIIIEKKKKVWHMFKIPEFFG